MFKRPIFRLCIVLTGVCLGLILLAQAQDQQSRKGRKYKAPPPSSSITVTVLKADTGAPVQNAAVIFHPIEGDKDKGGMELKTNEDGKALIDVIPVGDTVRLQVIAHGFQTYGGDYKVDKTEMSMEVRLNRPGKQYSIYQNHDTPQKDAGKDAEKDGSSGDKTKNQEQQAPQQSQPQPQ